ncbi:MAG: CDGSH iron-sulfur domain-containing protein [Planctomycetes bacterium]|nr:CDGSH iron-sulfur domain-containing protein [Planctomycetota bacterium]
MDSQARGKIEITRDGPYRVSPDIHLDHATILSDNEGASEKWSKGDDIPNPHPGQPYMLCRCGHSKSHPFCDGNHNDVGFVGTEHANRPSYSQSAKIYRGQTVHLMDDEELCAGARFCDRGATVWGLVQSSDQPGNREMAIQESCDCPSGRLTVIDGDGTVVEPKLSQEDSVVQDPIYNCRGPLWAKGGIEIEDAKGGKYEVRNRVTLCRCGESKNQPFCDGSHYDCPHMHGSDE